MKNPNYRQTDALLKSCSKFKSMLQIHRSRFTSIIDIGHVIQKLQALIFSMFHWVLNDVEGTPRNY